MKFQVIDLFCGAGGVTSGILKAMFGEETIAEVIACINHDPVAIESHAANHSETVHFIEDIKNFDVTRFPAFDSSPDTFTALWASLECTNFSNAKGGLPRDADSRTLANHLFRYIKYLNTDYILIENVKEFMSWGDLDENGRPISKDRGRQFIRWMNKVCTYGYNVDYRILNAADFGANTSRKRLFMVFAKKGFPIVWPEPTHSKTGDIFGKKKWRPVKEVLDLEDKGQSIFSRKKPLSEKTYRRIYAGLVKYVAGGDPAWLLKYNSASNNKDVNKGNSINNPSPVISTQVRLGLVQPAFIQQHNSGSDNSRVISLDKPANTVTTSNRFSLIQSEFLCKYHGNGENILSSQDCCSTITTKDRLALVQSDFLLNYNHSSECNSIENPSPTILTKDKIAIIKTEQFIDIQHSQGKQNDSIENPSDSVLPVPKQKLISADKIQFIDEQFGESKGKSLDEPAGSILPNPKQNLVSAWVMTNQYNNVGKSIEEPAQTILASRHHHYLMNPQYLSKGSSIDDPCFTLIARMDKKPPYLISTENGELAIEVYESDSCWIKKIKEFMAAFGIVDIYMRMLKIPELLGIQGFDKNYILKGNQTNQKKFIGNAVPPVVPQRMIEALYAALLEINITELRKAA
jgi:DNA (cytosine-5)-methyltransferase 1